MLQMSLASFMLDEGDFAIDVFGTLQKLKEIVICFKIRGTKYYI